MSALISNGFETAIGGEKYINGSTEFHAMHDMPSERGDKQVFVPEGDLKLRGKGLKAFDENVRMNAHFPA